MAVKAARRTAGSYHPEVGALSFAMCPVILGEFLKFSDAGVKCIYENIKIHHHIFKGKAQNPEGSF